VYNSASHTTKSLLDPIENEGLRIATGAFKSTPVASLQILTNQMPLDLRRLHLSLKYYYKLRSHITNPAFSSVVPRHTLLSHPSRTSPQPLFHLLNQFIDDHHLPRCMITPAFSYNLLNITRPSWSVQPFSLNTDLLAFPKATTEPHVYRQNFHFLLTAFYEDHFHIYTDGSKVDWGVGAAAVGVGVLRRMSLPKQASIFTAELYAIHLALNLIPELHHRSYVIFCDSLAALQSLQDRYSPNCLSRKLQHRLHDLLRTTTIELCWVPGHAGIPGNELADSTAKAACSLPSEPVMVHYEDIYPILKNTLYTLWERRWDTYQTPLRTIKPTPGSWIPLTANRRREVLLHRLRSQHTRLTHGYLMDMDMARVPPPCPWCDNCILTIPHLLLDCVALHHVRRRCFPTFVHSPTITLSDVIGDGIDPSPLFAFLGALQVINDI